VYVLSEQPEADAARAHHVAAIRRLFAADETKNRRLARTIAPDKSDMLARIKL
jgi:hypothetical protein